MQEHEVVRLSSVPPDAYRSMVRESLRYALLSKPFTIKRMGGLTIGERILNIFKGKLAELLFGWFAQQHLPDADRDSCATPFYRTDQRDLIWRGIEWDIKNNFVYHAGDRLTDHGYTQLPALVPDRHAHDQWAKRTEIKNPDLAGAAGFIFTFLKGASLKGSMRHDPFCTLTLSAEQQGWLLALEDEYGGLPLTDPPFDEAWFFDELAARGRRDVLYIHYFPHLYITAYALPQHFPMFRRTGPGDEDLNWADHLQGNWYSRTARGSCNFLKDTLWTTIPNATAPVAMLPSFQSLLSGGHQ